MKGAGWAHGGIGSPWTNRSRTEKQRPAKLLLEKQGECYVSPEERLLCLFHSPDHAVLSLCFCQAPLLALITCPETGNSRNITTVQLQDVFTVFFP